MHQRLRHPASLASIFSVILFVGSGCTEHRPPDELARAVSMGERPVAMQGSGVFFGGRIAATVTVSRGIGKGQPRAANAKRSFQSTDRGPNAEIPDVSGMETEDANAYIRAKMAVGSPLPPVTLHLKLENHGKETVSVEVSDFDSDLGNFAVHPEVLSLAPEQTAEPDPMVSQLGVTSDDIPVKVTLKSAGKTETQMIAVKSLLAPAPQKGN